MSSSDEMAKRSRRERNNESARKHRERTKKSLEELRIMKEKEVEWRKEYDKVLSERNNLLEFLFTHDCLTSKEQLQHQYNAFYSSVACEPQYHSMPWRNEHTFDNHDESYSPQDFTFMQVQMLPRPSGFCLNDYPTWEKRSDPSTISQDPNQPAFQAPAQPKYSSFMEFLAAKTGYTPAAGRYTPFGKTPSFWNRSPMNQARSANGKMVPCSNQGGEPDVSSEEEEKLKTESVSLKNEDGFVDENL